MAQTPHQCLCFNWGNFYLPKKFVIPAKAGIQSFVYSIAWDGLVPGLRREDGFLEVSLVISSCFARVAAVENLST
jgi:hypothetical protein